MAISMIRSVVAKSLTTSGASSFEKYEAIKKLIRRLDVKDANEARASAKEKPSDVRYDHSESEVEA